MSHEEQKAPSEIELYRLLRAVQSGDIVELPPAWVLVADAAKRAGYVREYRMQLQLTKHGQTWLALRDGKAADFTLTKIRPEGKHALKRLAIASGVPMQDVIGEISTVLADEHDRLASFALKKGLRRPWDAIPALLDVARVKKP